MTDLNLDVILRNKVSQPVRETILEGALQGISLRGDHPHEAMRLASAAIQLILLLLHTEDLQWLSLIILTLPLHVIADSRINHFIGRILSIILLLPLEGVLHLEPLVIERIELLVLHSTPHFLRLIRDAFRHPVKVFLNTFLDRPLLEQDHVFR